MRACDNCGVDHDEFSACDEQDVEDRMYELSRDELFERDEQSGPAMSSDAGVDPVALLKEIAQIAMDRMNYGGVELGEAMVLGKITAAAVRYPGVLEGLRDVRPGVGVIFDHEFAGADLRRCGRPGCGRPAGDHQYSSALYTGGVGGMSFQPDDSMRVQPVVTD